MEGLLQVLGDFLVAWSYANRVYINIIYGFIFLLVALSLGALVLGRWRAFILNNYYAPKGDQLLHKIGCHHARIKGAIVLVAFLSACYLACIALMSTFYIQPAMYWLKKKIETRLELEIHYKYITGSILNGRYVFHDFYLAKKHHGRRMIDLRIPELSFKISTWPFKSLAIENLGIEGMQAYIDAVFMSKFNGEQNKDKKTAVRSPLNIKRYHVSSSAMRIRYGVKEEVNWEIMHFKGSHYRGDDPIFNVLLAAEFDAKLNGHRFEAKHHHHHLSHIVDWHFENVPAFWLKHTLQIPPFTWLDQGNISVNATNRWKDHTAPRVQTHWSLKVNGVTLANHKALSLDDQLLFIAMQRYMHDQKRTFNVGFITLLENHKLRQILHPFAERFAESIYDSITEYLRENAV